MKNLQILLQTVNHLIVLIIAIAIRQGALIDVQGQIKKYGKCTYPLGFVTDSTEKKEVGCFGFGVDEWVIEFEVCDKPESEG